MLLGYSRVGGDFLDATRYERLRKDAERNVEVGRFLSAAREFQALSLMAEKDGIFDLAGEFAAKSGDCWLKDGRHASAATMYEQAAKYFRLSGKASHEKLYLRKAFAEFLLASRVPEESSLSKVGFTVRAAKCASLLGEQATAKRLLLKAYDLSLSSAASSLTNGEYDSAVTHYLFAVRCCAELGDKERELQIHTLIRESLTRLIYSLITKLSGEQAASIQSLFKNWFTALTTNGASGEYLEQASELVSECLNAALEFKRTDIAQIVLGALLESDPFFVSAILEKPSVITPLTSLITFLSADDQDPSLLSSLLQPLFRETSSSFLINYLPDAALQRFKKSLDENVILSQTPEELKSKLALFLSKMKSSREDD